MSDKLHIKFTSHAAVYILENQIFNPHLLVLKLVDRGVVALCMILRTCVGIVSLRVGHAHCNMH